MDVVLENFLAVLSLTTSDIEASVSSQSLDEVTLVGEGAFISSDYLEPAAVVFAIISDNFNCVVNFVLEDAQA